MGYFCKYKLYIMADQKTVEKIINSLRNSDEASVEALKNDIFPYTFYRYGQLGKNMFNSLERSSVWLSNYRELNDPFECFMNLDFDNYIKQWNYEKEYFELYGSSLSQKELFLIDNSDSPLDTFWDICELRNTSNFKRPDKTILKEQMQAITSAVRNFAYMGCFSEKWDSLLMWSHYANCGKGVCLEYDFKSIDKSYFHPVYYSNNILSASPNKSDIPVRNLIKGKEWEYEKEWRFVFYYQKMEDNKRYYILPMPTKILLGPRFEDNCSTEKEKLHQIAIQNKIPIVKTTLHTCEYKLVIENK